MGGASPRVRRVLELPKAERREALAELVIGEFRAVLRLPDTADFSRRTGFFDLGMTSLRLTELRQRLTRLFGAQLREETFFEHATLDGLLEYLVDIVLPEQSGATAAPAPAERPTQLDELLAQLYR